MSTHQQLLYHIVFSTKQRKPYLKQESFRQYVFEYMEGTIQYLGGSPIKVGGYFDHAHILVRIPAKIAVSKFVGQLKAHSSKHINEVYFNFAKFGWQDGFGAFTVSPSQKGRVGRYIENQLMHHQLESFENEYLSLLDKHGVEYDRKYVFD